MDFFKLSLKYCYFLLAAILIVGLFYIYGKLDDKEIKSRNFKTVTSDMTKEEFYQYLKEEQELQRRFEELKRSQKEKNQKLQ